MESSELREQLAAVERGAAAPYISYPPTPWWYPPAIGAWAAAMIGAFTWFRHNGALFAAALAILIALELLFLTWMRSRHGALPMPGRGRPPVEIAVLWRRYFLGLAVVVVAVALAWWLGGIPVAAPLAFALTTAGLIWYERSYAVAAAKVRERLS